MNVLVASNDNYVNPAIVCINSLILNNRNVDFTIYYMHYGLKEKNLKKIKKSVINSRGKICFVKIHNSEFNHVPVCGHITKETYFRFLAIKYLPSNVERILYLDPDIVINQPIDRFYNQSFLRNINEDYYMIVCEERELTKNNHHLYELGIPSGYKYFNAGVLLINIKLWRKSFELERVYKYIEDNAEKLLYFDQDILNAFYYDKVKYMDYRLYNFMPHSIISKDKNQIKKAKIIHYAGPSKPWKYGYKYFGREIYLKYVHISGLNWWYLKSYTKTRFQIQIKNLKKRIKNIRRIG